jgi:hypothetical protein
MKIKAKLKNCSIYPHRKDVDERRNVEIDVECIELYAGTIQHIAGMADDLETYHCWNQDDIDIIKIDDFGKHVKNTCEEKERK